MHGFHEKFDKVAATFVAYYFYYTFLCSFITVFISYRQKNAVRKVSLPVMLR